MSNPKLSEIRLLQAQAIHTDEDFTQLLHTDIPYLLDLVKRLGEALEELLQDDYTKHMRRDDVREARALLLEIKE